MNTPHLYYVYMLTNKGNSVIYIGVTSNIITRILQHREGVHDGFTKKYACNKLVYVETFQWIQHAIEREKRLKRRLKTKQGRSDQRSQSGME